MTTTKHYLLRIIGTGTVVTEDGKILVFENRESAELHRLVGALPEGVEPEGCEVEAVEVEN